MKTKTDPRHQNRIKILKALYSKKFANTAPHPLHKNSKKFKLILENIAEIDTLINRYTTRFTSEKMAKIDLSILELGVYEIMFEKQTPYKVVLDECIELAKEFGASNSAKFVNGILGKLVEEGYDQ